MNMYVLDRERANEAHSTAKLQGLRLLWRVVSSLRSYTFVYFDENKVFAEKVLVPGMYISQIKLIYFSD